MNILHVIAALIAVESGGNDKAVGKHDELGALQIKRVMVDDCNRILKRRAFTYSDRLDRGRSTEMFYIQISYYLAPAQLGHDMTPEEIARFWNGGPNHWRKRRTLAYWNRVRIELAGIEAGAALKAKLDVALKLAPE